MTIFDFSESVWLKRDATCPEPNQMTLRNLLTLLQKCAIPAVKTGFCTGPKVCHLCGQHSFSTQVMKGLRNLEWASQKVLIELKWPQKLPYKA